MPCFQRHVTYARNVHSVDPEEKNVTDLAYVKKNVSQVP